MSAAASTRFGMVPVSLTWLSPYSIRSGKFDGGISDSDESGKTPGTDLREGVPTLPELLLRAAAPDPSIPGDLRLRELLDAGFPADDPAADERHAEALTLFRAHPALARAREDTLRYSEEARALLAPLPDCPAKSALEGLCDVVALRTM